MKSVDLNLLKSLDVLLSERSVTRAANILGLSPSAMSRTLTRLRIATGDQLLVRAGRTLVPTRYAERLAENVHELALNARAVLQPASNNFVTSKLDRTFSIRTNDGFVDRFGASVISAIHHAAPNVRIRFISKPDKDPRPLREGVIDLEIGVLGTAAPELKTKLLFRAKFVGICRTGHPLLDKSRITARRYVEYQHVVVSRKHQFFGPVDDALAKIGLRRNVVSVVPTFFNALQIVRHSDVLGIVPQPLLEGESTRIDGTEVGLRRFELPVRTPEIKISAIWHPRHHADPAHRWLRDTLAGVCSGRATAWTRHGADASLIQPG